MQAARDRAEKDSWKEGLKRWQEMKKKNLSPSDSCSPYDSDSDWGV